MASNSVSSEKYSCRYLDGTQHIDIAAELYNIGNSVEDLQMDELIQIMDGLTYIQQLVPEQLLSSEFEQLPAPADFNSSYQMTLSLLPATIPGDSATSSSPGDSNFSYQMTPSLLPATIPDDSAIPTSSHPPTESNNISTFARPKAPKTSLRMSKTAARGLKQWFDSNNPYPNKKETKMLASNYDITVVQVRKWFSNRRLRNKKPKTPSASTSNDIPYDFNHLQSAF